MTTRTICLLSLAFPSLSPASPMPVFFPPQQPASSVSLSRLSDTHSSAWIQSTSQGSIPLVPLSPILAGRPGMPRLGSQAPGGPYGCSDCCVGLLLMRRSSLSSRGTHDEGCCAARQVGEGSESCLRHLKSHHHLRLRCEGSWFK